MVDSPQREKYDRDYFESGHAKGVSGYTNYMWLPELTIPLAHRLVLRLGLQPGARVLDYGCAKGYLVRALCLLGMDAYGCDISRYALEHAHPDVRNRILQSTSASVPFQSRNFDWILAKDVLEHLTPSDLTDFLASAQRVTSKLFVVVPLGDGEKYNVPQYEKDVTHVLRWSAEQWRTKFESLEWRVVSETTNMTGIKDSWAHHQDGNAAFVLRKRKLSNV